MFWGLTAICAALPDIDVLGFSFVIRYRDMLGHRGLTHSLPFALVIACLVALVAFKDVKMFSLAWWKLSCYFFVRLIAPFPTGNLTPAQLLCTMALL